MNLYTFLYVFRTDVLPITPPYEIVLGVSRDEDQTSGTILGKGNSHPTGSLDEDRFPYIGSTTVPYSKEINPMFFLTLRTARSSKRGIVTFMYSRKIV